MNETVLPDMIKAEFKVEGYLLFEKMRDGKLREVLRTTDIINVTNRADDYSRAWPGVEFIVYSGLTGKWYTYFKPIN